MAKTVKKTESKKKSAPKAAKVKASPKKAAKAIEGAPALELEGLDRKALAQKARQIKTELLAVRFNIQAPNLKEYRKKRSELATVMNQLKMGR
jgi:hypothetical protein